MNRREAIATALASMTLPRALIAGASAPSYSSFPAPGFHRFVNGVCECGQKTTDDPERCDVFGPRIYSVEQGDHGEVWLDGKQVKAVACCPDQGWAECMVDERGKPLGINEPPVITGNRVAKSVLYGRVRFEPTK